MLRNNNILQDEVQDRDVLILSDLQKGMPGISPVEGAFLQENAVVALHNAGHKSPTSMKLNGVADRVVDIEWDDEHVTDQILATHNDEQETIEFAAMGISVLLTTYLTDCLIILRSRKGTGFDYKLGDKDSPFMPTAILEISGLSKESENNTLQKRAGEKRKQISQSDDLHLDEYISIIEMATPKALYEHINADQ